MQPIRIIFMGSSQASATVLRGILRDPTLKIVGVVTQPDRPSGRNRKLTPCPCKVYAQDQNLGPIITPEHVNAPEVLDQLRQLRPDVIAVVAFGQILGKKLLDMAPHGCVNGHFSLLPKYRGASPVQAAILSGDKVTGVTFMKMDEHMDTGDILTTATEPICSDDTSEALMERLAILAAVKMPNALRAIVEGKLKPKRQNEELASYSGKIKKSDGLIDWSQSTRLIRRRLNAYFPWPGVYTYEPKNRDWCGPSRRIKIIAVQLPKAEIEKINVYEPGMVCEVSREGLYVKTADGALMLSALQLDGGRPLDWKSFLNGHPLAAGDRFEMTPEV